MNEYSWIKDSLKLLTCFIAVPIYIVFLYMIVRYRKLPMFNIPFYGLIFQCGLLDLWYVVHEYLLYDPVLVNLVPNVFIWARVEMATVSFYGYLYIRACQVMAVLAISVNRFTALATPLRHDLIWTRKVTWLSIIIGHVVAALLTAPALAGGCYRDYILADKGVEYQLDTTFSQYCVSLLGVPPTLFVTFVSVTLILLYSIAFVKARHSNMAVGHGNQSANERKVQLSLAMGGAIISFTLVLNTCMFLYAIVILIRTSKSDANIKVFKSVLDTLFCIINPFVLLCFGSKVRPYYWKCVRQILCMKQNNQTQSQERPNDIPLASVAQINNNIIINNYVVVESL